MEWVLEYAQGRTHDHLVYNFLLAIVRTVDYGDAR